MTNSSYDYYRFRLVNIIENAELTNPQLPNWFFMFPRRNQTNKDLPVTRLFGRPVSKLCVDAI